jgi:hypothetical protein
MLCRKESGSGWGSEPTFRHERPATHPQSSHLGNQIAAALLLVIRTKVQYVITVSRARGPEAGTLSGYSNTPFKDRSRWTTC